MEEKHKNLINSQQKELLNNIVARLNESHPSFYYLSTIEIAAEIKKYILESGNLSHDDSELMKGLSREDIQILLSFHNS